MLVKPKQRSVKLLKCQVLQMPFECASLRMHGLPDKKCSRSSRAESIYTIYWWNHKWNLLVKWHGLDVILKEESRVSQAPQKVEFMYYSSIRDSSPARNKSGEERAWRRVGKRGITWVHCCADHTKHNRVLSLATLASRGGWTTGSQDSSSEIREIRIDLLVLISHYQK